MCNRMSSWWDRHVVPHMIGYCCGLPQLQRRRAAVVPLASGNVLELGAGGAPNLAFYDRARVQAVTGIEPSPEMAALATSRMQPADHEFFHLIDARAEELPFADASFDTVLTTFTLCTVADQAQALREARRVLKPGGRLLFLEHGLAPHEATRRWQHRIDPLWCRLAGGCHLVRPVTDAIAAAGFHVPVRHGRYLPKSPRVVGWVEWGEASVPAPAEKSPVT